MPGNTSRRIGKKAERELVLLARQAGLDAERLWYRAQDPDPIRRKQDLEIEGMPVQVKKQYSAFRKIYSALEGVELACIRSDKQPWLGVMRADALFELLYQLRALRTRLQRIEATKEYKSG